LANKNVYILNFLKRTTDYAHWPEPRRSRRRAAAIEESDVIIQLCESDRIIPIIEEPIAVVAALLEQCQYFVGVDNGIKHLAWALGVPLTLLMPEVPDRQFILRWIPDLHRIACISNKEDIEKHVNEAVLHVR